MNLRADFLLTNEIVAFTLHWREDQLSIGTFSEGWGAYSFVACFSHLTIDNASLSRRS